MTNSICLFFIMCCIATQVHTLDKYDFFVYGEYAGDTILVDVNKDINPEHKDDAVFFIDVGKHIPFLDVENNTKFQLSTNGYVAFGYLAYDVAFPQPFPRTHYVEGIPVPQVAVYHTDLIFMKHWKSAFSYNIYNELDGYSTIHQASYDINKYFHNTFKATRVFVATWKYASPYDLQEDTVSFQMALATNEYETYLFLHYGKLNITEFMPTAVGWQGKALSNFFEHPLSTLEDTNGEALQRTLKLASDSNVGKPGKWIYRVAKPLVKLTTQPPSPTKSVAKCPYFPSNFCKYLKDGSYYHAEHFYIVCEYGHGPRCMACATENLHFVEKCNQCVAKGTQECEVTPPPVTATTVVPFGGCSETAATRFCAKRSNGRYNNPNDVKDSTFFWCYSTGASCMYCAAGTKFCPIKTLDGHVDGRCE